MNTMSEEPSSSFQHEAEELLNMYNFKFIRTRSYNLQVIVVECNDLDFVIADIGPEWSSYAFGAITINNIGSVVPIVELDYGFETFITTAKAVKCISFAVAELSHNNIEQLIWDDISRRA